MNTVTPIQGRPLCFYVKSRTKPDQPPYYVDWLEHYCTCPDYHKTAQRKTDEAGQPYVCWHMERARDCGWNNYVETTREILLNQ
jgi:hypothetical protein